GLRAHIVGPFRARLQVFLGAVGFVLLIGCANVANLLLVRATGRRREFAVRVSLGAGRLRLLRQLLTESLLLAAMGGALGLLLALWATRAFLSLAPAGIPRLEEVGIDGRVLGFALLLSAITALLFGLAPALRATTADVNQALKGGRHAGRSSGGIHRLLVVGELALAFMLLVGAGLLTRSFSTFLQWQPGFDRENLTTTWLLSSPGKYERGDQVVALHARAAEAVAALPDVVSVGMASAGPLFGGIETDEFVIADHPAEASDNPPVARWFDIDARYFPTLGLSIVRGRNFTDADTRGSVPVAIINEAMARRYWRGENPLEHRVTMHDRTMEIVGVVHDILPLRPDAVVEPQIYWPDKQSPRWGNYLVIRTRSDASSIVHAARERMLQEVPDLQISTFRTMQELVGRRLVSPRFNMLLVVIFAAVAVVLAAVGTYGVIAYSIASRTQEIGIRMALGARPWGVTFSVVRHGMTLALIGLGLGFLGALGLSRVIASLLYGLPPDDPATFAAVGGIFMAVALLACYLPARRAARLDPMSALHTE
ncbi:MAG: FtsX-like permease family protein, partial [Acidobacteriota bacterium]